MEIEFKISDTVIDGNTIARKVRFEGIDYLSRTLKEARIIWKVFLVDKEGLEIVHPDLFQGRRVESPMSNSNKVDRNGIMITKDYTDSIFKMPSEEEIKSIIKEDESLDDLIDRLKSEFYQKYLEEGYPEFDFYWGALFQYKLPEVLAQSVPVLDELKRFDRIN